MVDVGKIVKFVEEKLGTKSNQDGKIQRSNAAEYSLFMAEMGRQVREEGLEKTDFNNMLNEAFGLELSDKPAAARSGGLGNEPTDTNINITINIDIDIVIKACGGCDEDKEAALQQLVDMLIAEMTREGGKVENFIVGLINAFSKTADVDFSSLETLLNQIMQKLDEQGQKIDGLQQSVDELSGYLKGQLETLFKTLDRYAQRYNIDITDIKQMLKDCDANDKEILQKIGDVYSAIMNLTGMFQEFTKVEQTRFNEAMTAISNIKVDGGDTSGIMRKLEYMESLLLAIQNDTSETKENSATLIELVRQGKEEVLNAIYNINVTGTAYDDTQLRNMLNSILTNMVTKGDLDAQLAQFNQLLANLQSTIEYKMNASEENIINHMNNVEKNIKLAIANITVEPGNPDNSALISLLNDLMAKLNEMDAKNAQNFSNVFQAIANIKPGEVDLSQVLALLNEIRGLAEANGGKLNNVLNNQEAIKLTLTGILEGLSRLEGKVDGVRTVVDDIKDIVSKLHNCDCKCIDEDRLREILCEFVDKVNTKVNEGVNNDLSDLLGARRDLRSVLGLEDVEGVESPTIENKNSQVYDLSGRPVNGPLQDGTVYIRDGKKFIHRAQ